MPITFGEAKGILSQYVGRGGSCPEAKEVNQFVRKVLEYMLYSGHYGNLRKFCFHAVKGCFTAPYELEMPEKIKIDGAVGTVWDKWFEWHPGKPLLKCIPTDNALFEEPNYVCTAYEVPPCGVQPGCVATCEEDCDAKLLVQGKDLTGREIYTNYRGEQVHGVYLSIKKGVLQYSEVTFGTIDAVLKPKTNGYVQLYGLAGGSKKFLADYSPVEEKPQYRKFRLADRNCPAVAKVSILGRIRLKPFYMDNDYIPFDNLYTLELAGQAVNSQFNNDIPSAQAKDQTLQDLITRENEYKRVNNGQPIEVYIPTSCGSIRNIIGTFFSRRF